MHLEDLSKRVLVVDADFLTSQHIKSILQESKFSVVCVENLSQCASELDQNNYDILLMDVTFPDGSAIDFIARLRSRNCQTPCIFLTCLTDENTVVGAFTAGVTDYIYKPVRARELLARLKSALQNSGGEKSSISAGSLIIDAVSRVVTYKGKSATLNQRQYEIINFLTEATGRAASRGELLTALSKNGPINDRTLDSHISHLRTNLRKADFVDVEIVSVYGMGYRLDIK